ncbi:MAG: hypothetical protein IT450_03140 [Phycisphaerales bacterium]|nr:hypothetical protein [Phycisphaerales bacterium]
MLGRFSGSKRRGINYRLSNGLLYFKCMGKAEIISALPGLTAQERAEVRAKLDELADAPGASPEMVAHRKAALQRLRALGGLREVIPDPVTWQRELREDRPLDRR